MKFKSNIELHAGLEDNNADTGSSGQILSSTGAGVEWIDQSAVIGAKSNFIYFEVKNETGSPINKGKGVMAVGTDGNSGHILIDEMIADGSVEPKFFLGILEDTLNNGEFGRAISFGQLDQFNTNGQNGETWNNSDVLWCDPDSPGDFTITEPNGPNVKIPAAIVLNAATNGKIQIRVQANEGIRDLYDTQLVSQVDGDILVWNNTTGVWFNDSTLNIDYTNGNVGIGTTTPSGLLHLSKNNTLSLFLERTGAAPSLAALRNQSAQLQLETNGFNGIGFFTGTGTPTERFRLNSSGNFGIGTTAPLTRFHNVLSSAGTIAWTATSGTSAIFESGVSNRNFVNIVAPSTGQSELWFGNQTNEVRGRVRYNHSDDSLALWTSATERLTIDSTGDVGIGTTVPSEKLEVDGNVLADNYKRVGDIAETNFTYDYTNVDNSTDVIPIFAVSNNRLIVKEGSFTSLNTGDIKIGTLPSGARPDATRYVFGYSTTRGSIVFQILTNGDVVLLGSSTTGTNYLDFEITLDTSIITTE